MLVELRVENLLLMERAELRLAPGLNVLTGETGAGKTLLAHALDLLLGGRARNGIVRAGAAEAYVEGIFSLPAGWQRELGALPAGELIPTDADEVALGRRVWPDGRTRAYVCGRSATVSDLRELGARFVAFYGQHEHRKLTLSTAQLDVLDAHCGSDHLRRRAALGVQYEHVRAVDARAGELRALAGARERELDLLAFELSEIEAADPGEQEERELPEERQRLLHATTLRDAAAVAAEAISPEGDRAGGGLAEQIAQAVRSLDGAAAVDARLGSMAERLQASLYEVQDVGADLRGYLLDLEVSPGRLEEVEARLSVLNHLTRKHGGTIAEVLAHAEHCRARRAELMHADDALAGADAELTAARAQLDELADELHRRRMAAAPGLAAAVCERLGELAMPDARFEVQISPRPDGCGPRGRDGVELVIAPNPGVPAGPLREIASGGELSRVMLALLSVAHGGGNGDQERVGGPLLVFDEIDAGIGGHTARAVGEHLKSLAGGRQLLCITHLPQVAALAERHFTIVKHTGGEAATTTVTELGSDGVVGELVRMLGAGEDDRVAAKHARQLLRAA